jgi:hypothetical protein
MDQVGRIWKMIRYWHYVVADGLWIVEANLNISNHNIIVILTDTMISIRHDLVGRHYEYLFYRQYKDHLKCSLSPNIPAKLSSLFHKYSRDEVNEC